MAGRPKKATTEKLYQIIELYFKNNDIYGQVSKKDIAAYAQEALGYKNIRAYDFGCRNKEISKYLDDINKGLVPIDYKNRKLEKFTVNINVDNIVENYYKDKLMLKTYLKQIEKKYNSLNKDKEIAIKNINILEKENEVLKIEVEHINKQWKQKEKELKTQINELKSQNIALKKFKKLENIIKLTEELHEKGFIKEYDYQSIIMHFKKAKLIENNDKYDLSSELFDFIEDEEIGEEEAFLKGIL